VWGKVESWKKEKHRCAIEGKTQRGWKQDMEGENWKIENGKRRKVKSGRNGLFHRERIVEGEMFNW
jgi:hypothetical protein